MERKIMTLFVSTALIASILSMGFAAKSVNATNGDPWLEVKPNYYMTDRMETFNVSVWLHVTADKRLIGVDFRLSYNTTLLKVVNAAEGPALPAWAPPGSLGTFFAYSVEPEDVLYPPHVLVGNMIFPNETGYWKEPFPEGSGEIATITFEGIYPRGSCPLNIIEQHMISVLVDGMTVADLTYGTPKSGYYDIWPLLCDVNRDKRVNIIDVCLIAKAFGSVPGDPRWNPRYNLCLRPDDSNHDRNEVNEIIDILDLAMTIFKDNFGKSIP